MAAEAIAVCGCEHESHFTDGKPRTGHEYLAVPAGPRVAQYVGPVCDPCAETCMASYLVKVDLIKVEVSDHVADAGTGHGAYEYHSGY